MRSVLFLVAVSLSSWCSTYAGDESNNAPVESSSSNSELLSYTVQLTEFRLKEALDPRTSEQDIVRLLAEPQDGSKFEVRETVRLSTLANHESRAHFGKSITVAVGTTQSQFGRVSNTQRMEIGTSVRVTANTVGEKVTLKLMYEAARFNDHSPDSPPDVTTTTFETTLALTPGKPTLVGGATKEHSSYLLITVMQ